MNEDTQFEGFLKTRLEEGISLSPKSLAAIQVLAAQEAKRKPSAPHRRPFAAILAAAAGLAILCGFGVVYLQSQTSHTVDQTIVQTIEFLNDAEELGLTTTNAMDTADILLAWQDAPYTRLQGEIDMDGLTL